MAQELLHGKLNHVDSFFLKKLFKFTVLSSRSTDSRFIFLELLLENLIFSGPFDFFLPFLADLYLDF